MKKLLGTPIRFLFCLSAMSVTTHAGEPSFEIYGFTQGDYIQDFDRVDPTWQDTLRPSKIGTAPGEFGSNGQASLSPKQSRLGVKSSMPVEGNDLSTQLEFDFFGVGVDAGQTTIRLRHAYGEWGQWLAGQTHSLFMDIDVFPNIIDYWGPCGMVFLRTPQIRWTPVSGDLSFSVAIEKPDTGIDAGQIREVDPELGANLQNDEKLPDLTAQVKLKRSWGHLQLAGILRRLGFDTLGSPDGSPKGNDVGWGLALTSNIKLLGSDKLILSGLFGRGIASYMNDGGVDLAPEGTPGNLQASAVPLYGVVAYYDHAWSDLWTTSLGYSRTQVSNRSFQLGTAFHSGDYASINLLYTPVKNMMAGAEFLWGQLIDNDLNNGTDIRTQISLKYSFSSKDFFGKKGT